MPWRVAAAEGEFLVRWLSAIRPIGSGTAPSPAAPDYSVNTEADHFVNPPCTSAVDVVRNVTCWATNMAGTGGTLTWSACLQKVASGNSESCAIMLGSAIIFFAGPRMPWNCSRG